MTVKTAPTFEKTDASSAEDHGYYVEQQIGFILRRAHQRATAIFESLMGRFDVTPTQFTIMIKLQDAGETSQNRLGRMAALDPATTFGVIARLKKRKLIAQRTDPGDARRILLRLSTSGLAQTKQMRSAASEISRETAAPLTCKEQETLIALLGKLT